MSSTSDMGALRETDGWACSCGTIMYVDSTTLELGRRKQYTRSNLPFARMFLDPGKTVLPAGLAQLDAFRGASHCLPFLSDAKYPASVAQNRFKNEALFSGRSTRAKTTRATATITACSLHNAMANPMEHRRALTDSLGPLWPPE